MCHIQRKTVSILTIPHVYLDCERPLSHLALTEGWSQPPQEGRDLQSTPSLLTRLGPLGHFYICFLIWICHAFYA